MSDEANRTELPPDRITALWPRIKQHRIAQWTVGYVAVAYGIQHAVTLTSEAFKWPDAVLRVSMLLLVLGLPVAMTLAWYHGERASRRISAGEFSILSVLLVGVAILFYSFVRPAQENSTAASAPVQEPGVATARQASLDPHGGVAVAVLPFANLSDDKQQDYFSDGMTDEIGTALTKIPDLRVVARQSAYRFKNTKEDSRQIGQSLGATHLIEGSVYKAGNRVRITAELVKADNGLSIWSEKYDRDLTDVFAIQEDIARAIATSFHMTLGLKPGENLVNQRTKDATLHDAFLRGRNLIRNRDPDSLDAAIKLLTGALARDSNYAPAWAALADAYHFKLLSQVARITDKASLARVKPITDAWIVKEKDAAERAAKLDGNDATSYYALSGAAVDSGDMIAAVDFAQRGLALDPDHADNLNSLSLRLAALGFLKQAVSLREHLMTVEPFVPVFRANTARILFADGQLDATLGMAGNGGASPRDIAQVYAAQGRYAEAANLLDALAPKDFFLSTRSQTAAAARILRMAPAAAPINDRPELGILDWVYVYAGAPELAVNIFALGAQITTGAQGTNGLQFAPAYASMRQTVAFKKYVRDSGILTFWRARGWPPQCHPTTGDDFECS